MTEKRFLMDEDGNITDTVEDRCLYVEDRHTECDYFYNLLNNFNDENIQLQQEVIKLTDLIAIEIEKNANLSQEINSLKIENMRLKEQK